MQNFIERNLFQFNYEFHLIHFRLVETADLVTFTEEIRNGKLHFLCSDSDEREHSPEMV